MANPSGKTPNYYYTEPDSPATLTPFLRAQAPRVQVSRDVEVRVSREALNHELRCSVCWGFLQQTAIVMDCLHRFCLQCIEKPLRDYKLKKECPFCRTHVSSRRRLRRDTGFDALIAVIYPDIDKYRAQDEQDTIIFNQTLNPMRKFREANTAQSEAQDQKRKMRAPLRPQQQTRAVKPRLSSPEPSATARLIKQTASGSQALAPAGSSECVPYFNTALAARSDPQHAGGKASPAAGLKPGILKYRMQFVPHPEERTLAKLDNPAVLLPAHCTIRQMKTWLSRMFKMSSSKHLELWCEELDQGGFVPLGNHLTYTDLVQTVWNSQTKLTVLYGLAANPGALGKAAAPPNPPGTTMLVKTEE